MLKIFKYTLKMDGETEVIQMPKGAKILSAQNQHEKVCIWAQVNPDAKLEDRTISIAGTGHEIKTSGGIFIGTVQMHSGDLVFHISDVTPSSVLFSMLRL